ncbi:hypothetical protein Tfont_00715 [Tepidimonas fonticaldi]|uniref:Uncharacterized protein n=1 Tax=Tepidimonas fonticaldi TaxID=1101373 RepID=A0A554XPI3_9BURK|nr:hypothetical protein [Tepidimonas fonticaldi]TSE37717.1 hypothetical protein Tfont_00715 [Tepidimonas fonticaldi]
MSFAAPSPQSRPVLRPVLHLAGWGVALGACAAVFAWYLEPDFLLTLADRLWSCF